MKVLNRSEVDSWLFEHCVLLANICEGIKGEVNGLMVNIAFVDRHTGESINVEYEP